MAIFGCIPANGKIMTKSNNTLYAKKYRNGECLNLFHKFLLCTVSKFTNIQKTVSLKVWKENFRAVWN